MKRSASKSGKSSKASIVSTVVDESTSKSLEEIREKLWRAFPTIQAQLPADVAQMSGPPDTSQGDEESLQALRVYLQEFSSVTVPWSEMRHLVGCLYLATHANPTPDDVEIAVQSVVGPESEPVKTSYDREDLYALLDTIPSKWLPHNPALFQKDNEAAVKALNDALIDSVTNDEPPNELLQHDKVLTISNPSQLVSHAADFIQFTEHRQYPEVYDTLWLNMTNGRPNTTVALSEFRVFFVWFYRLHFLNTSVTRSEAAAEAVYRTRLNAAGAMDVHSFILACNTMCANYASERNAGRYLDSLVKAATKALAERSKETKGSPFFELNGQLIEQIHPADRPTLKNPRDLYIKDELRAWLHKRDLYRNSLSRNRIVLHGRRFVGKTRVGKLLAEKLHCVHLDVTELALKAIRFAASFTPDATDGAGSAFAKSMAAYAAVGQHLQECLDTRTPFDLDSQAALIRHELDAAGAHYHGYVLSDTFSASSCIGEAPESLDHFFEASGIAKTLTPSAFVEITADDAVYEEIFATQTALLEAREAELSALEDHNNADQRESIRAECARILAHARDVEEGEDATDDEVAAAQQQAEEAREILAALDAEEKEEVKAAKAAAGDGQNDEEAETEEEKQRRHVVAKEEKKRMLVELLVSKGRESLGGNRAAATVPIGSLVSLKKSYENAKALNRVLTVDTLSAAEDSRDYIIQALHAFPCSVATDPITFSSAEETPTSEVEIANAKLEAAQTNNINPSLAWKQFCPVTLHDDGVLFEGSACYSAVFDGQLFYCASHEKLDRFKANPFLYLAQTPVDRKKLFVVANANVRKDQNGSMTRSTAVVDALWQELRLTLLPLERYAECQGYRRELQANRTQALAQRKEYEQEERELRKSRLEKRMKGMKKKQAKKPKTKGREEGRDRVTIKVDDAPRQEQRKRLEDTLQEQIQEAVVSRRDDVPVLVTLLEGSADMEVLTLLASEGALPQNVIVLDEVDSAAADGDEAGEENDDGNANDRPTQRGTTTMPTETEASNVDEVIKFFEHPPKEAVKKGAAPFSVSTVNLFGKTQKDVVYEILQIVNPCMPIVEDGVVDEELGENVEEEEEEEEEDGDDPTQPPRPREVVDPAVRPMKRFLNQFGARLNYCPVTLHEQGLFLRGRTDLCLRYLDRLYCFATEAHLTRFRRNPLQYVRHEPPRTIPPRVWVVGASRSGKRSLGKHICEQFNVPSFTYERSFFERVIEAAQKPEGEEVNGIFIPHSGPDCEYLARAACYLKELRDFAADQEKRLRLQKEAERTMEERERKAEEEDEAESEEEPEVDEELERQLQENLEFEPEEEEDRQVRLSEAYLRIMSCVVRVEPFESRGYVMICPPFSEGDLEVLFAEGGIPEVVVNMTLSPEVYMERARKAFSADEQRKQAEKEEQRRRQEQEGGGADAKPTKAQRAAALDKKRKERALRKWRRRHIGENDPASDGDDDADADHDRDGAESEVEMRVDIEGTRNLEEEAAAEFLQAIEDRRVEIVKVNAERSKNVVLQSALDGLARHLAHRISVFYAPEIVTFETAEGLLAAGTAALSNFHYVDPVALHDRRAGARRECRWKAATDAIVEEAAEERDMEMSFSDGTVLGGDEVGGRGRARSGDEGGSGGHNNNGADYLEDEEMSEVDEDELDEMRERVSRKERKLRAKRALRVALLGGKAFFFESDVTLKRFVQNPIYFVEQPPPAPKAAVLPAVALYENDTVVRAEDAFSGRKLRCLAESVAHNNGFLYINATKLLAWAALEPRLGKLATKAVACALHGGIDGGFLDTLLRVRLGAADVKARGAVLLNLPRTPEAVDRLHAYATAAPLMKVGCAMAAPSRNNESKKPMTAWVSAVAAYIGERALVELPVPRPSLPRDMANLVEVVRWLDAFVDIRESEALCEARAFPSCLSNTYHTMANIESHLSDYGWYCPYSWCVEQNLESTRGSRPLLGAKYLGKYYFFHCEAYLVRFLLEPTEVADPSTIVPLPPSLPSLYDDTAPGAEAREALHLELAGCCPVLLYDTRETKGLRGAAEPLAKKGSLKFIASYEGKHYAFCSQENLDRFMRRPWQYVGGAFTPEARKMPLAGNVSVDDETFIRRQLYDAVANAMIDAAKTRPKYPGLSVEESVLKYVALHLKSQNERNNDIQKQQYCDNFTLFQKRATLYRRMDVEKIFAAPGDPNMRAICREYDSLISGIAPVKELCHLRNVGGGGVAQ